MMRIFTFIHKVINTFVLWYIKKSFLGNISFGMLIIFSVENIKKICKFITKNKKKSTYIHDSFGIIIYNILNY